MTSLSSVRKTPTEAQKRMIAGRQSFKCANRPDIKLKGLETYQCPLWQKNKGDNPGSFDQSGFELDHIDELCMSGDNSLDNFQALCKSCHCVKTKKFLMKKANNLYHPVYGKFITKHGNHLLYLADSHVITRNSKIWSQNRPPDTLRIEELKRYIEQIGYVDGILYFANIPDEGLVCYDGNHRREALNLINKSFKIFINVIESPSYRYLCDKFVSLNKCVPVTELYLDLDINKEVFTNNDSQIMNSVSQTTPITKKETNISKEHIKQVILELAKFYADKWKDHRKTSPNPNRPHFNWDSLQLRLKRILEKENKINDIQLKSSESYKDLIKPLLDYIESYNTQIGLKKFTYGVSTKTIAKCDRNNCYIFLETL